MESLQLEIVPFTSPFSPSQHLSEVSSIKTFYRLILPYLHTLRETYFVFSIAIYKERSKAEHEFAAAEILGPHSSKSVLIVERTPEETAFSGTYRTLSSNNLVGARDTIISLDVLTFDEVARRRSATLLQRFTFDSPPGRDTFPAVDFCHIIASISTYQDSYTLLGSSCYWFAGMVMKMAQECFPVKQIIGNGNIAGRYKGIKIFVPEPKAMCDIMSLYKTKRNEEGSAFNYIIEAVLINVLSSRHCCPLLPPFLYTPSLLTAAALARSPMGDSVVPKPLDFWVTVKSSAFKILRPPDVHRLSILTLFSF
ncbi:hypothetical protein BU17DRAFT_94398 [Hysterangium stoloniferum]|nr:hypothetical protein BU17DRAFT_94398 [Hysterangium stoloniferum]